VITIEYDSDKHLDDFIQCADSLELAFPQCIVEGNEKEKEEDRDADDDDEKIAFKITINEIVLYEKKGGEKMKRDEEIIALLEDAVSEAEKAMKESRDGRGGCG
jgi:triphosphoribosyl-dephospho-CoA synthetase